MGKTESNTDEITRRAPRWAWFVIDQLLDMVIDLSAKDGEEHFRIEAENAKDAMVTVGEESEPEDDEDEERRERQAQPHCPTCGCDLHDGVCPEGCKQPEGTE